MSFPQRPLPACTCLGMGGTAGGKAATREGLRKLGAAGEQPRPAPPAPAVPAPPAPRLRHRRAVRGADAAARPPGREGEQTPRFSQSPANTSPKAPSASGRCALMQDKGESEGNLNLGLEPQNPVSGIRVVRPQP